MKVFAYIDKIAPRTLKKLVTRPDPDPGPHVVIRGDTAILSFYDPMLGAANGVRSSDVFVYVGGHWHALYSQHSAAAKG
jgi:hypothetical protein